MVGVWIGFTETRIQIPAPQTQGRCWRSSAKWQVPLGPSFLICKREEQRPRDCKRTQSLAMAPLMKSAAGGLPASKVSLWQTQHSPTGVVIAGEDHGDGSWFHLGQFRAGSGFFSRHPSRAPWWGCSPSRRPPDLRADTSGAGGLWGAVGGQGMGPRCSLSPPSLACPVCEDAGCQRGAVGSAESAESTRGV